MEKHGGGATNQHEHYLQATWSGTTCGRFSTTDEKHSINCNNLPQGFEYGRSGNPTRDVLERCLASLDNGKYGLTFSSGLGVTTTIITMLSAGDHVVAGDDLYGGTNRLLRQVAMKMNIAVDFVDTTDLAKVEAAIKPNTKLFWLETPTNPLLKVADIEAVCKIAHKFPGVRNPDFCVALHFSVIDAFFCLVIRLWLLWTIRSSRLTCSGRWIWVPTL